MRARSFSIRALLFIVVVAFVAMTAASAYAATWSLTVTTQFQGKTFVAPDSLITSGSVDTTAVSTWVNNTIAPGAFAKRADATLKVNKKKRRLDFKAARYGYSLTNKVNSANSICTALASIIASGTTQTVNVTVATTVIKPKVGNASFGKTILVSLVQRKIYLYDYDAKAVTYKVIKTYRCAVGQPRWPTPTGTFRIGKKVKNPSWTNGYASWSMNMPSYIGPGPNNPLGTRAMYVYKGKKDTGVRFHGVPHSEDSSIGHAASHGCLRMHRKDVENFFPRVKVGTTVIIIK